MSGPALLRGGILVGAASFAVYRLTGVSPEHALWLSLLQHVCYLIPMVGVGYLYGGMRVFKELRDPQPPS